MGYSYRELVVWQKAISTVTQIYKVTQCFPREETYGLTCQMRRAAVSVASNIAEGQGRITKGEFRQFLGQARGSLLELETQLVVAGNLGYLSEQAVRSLIDRTGEISRLLHRLIQSLQPTTRN